MSEADLEKQYKEIPNSDFTKSGNKVTVEFSGKDIDLNDLINNLSATYSIPKEQTERLIKESKNIDISKLSVKLTVDKKSHEKKHLKSLLLQTLIHSKKCKMQPLKN